MLTVIYLGGGMYAQHFKNTCNYITKKSTNINFEEKKGGKGNKIWG